MDEVGRRRPPGRAASVSQLSSVKSSDRTLDVLELLSTTNEALTLTEIARRLDFPKSSTYKLLMTLERRQWITSDPVSHTRYRIGLRALLAGTRFVDADDVVQSTSSVLDELAESFGEAVHLGRLDGTDIVYLAKRESRHPFRMYSAVGRRLPAHSTAMGKATLAQLSHTQLDDLLPDELPQLTARTITSKSALKVELARVAEQGYAVDDEESTEMLRAVAVRLPPRADSWNAISISAPISRLPIDRVPEIAAAIVEATRGVAATSVFDPGPGAEGRQLR